MRCILIKVASGSQDQCVTKLPCRASVGASLVSRAIGLKAEMSHPLVRQAADKRTAKESLSIVGTADKVSSCRQIDGHSEQQAGIGI
jgi:hypothetical protein